MDGDDFMMDQQAKFDDDFEEEIYDEDRYDALNDETFGNDMSDGDWETDHEKYAKFDEDTKKGWPDEMHDDLAISETNVFSESLKSLPNLERELRQLHTFDHHYEIPPPMQYPSNFNFVNPNININLLSDNCGLIRRPIPLQASTSQNVFNPPPGFNERNGHIDEVLNKPSPKVMSSAINVADLERQMMDAVKIYPTVSCTSRDLHQQFISTNTHYNQDQPRFQILSRGATVKNFPRNNTTRNQGNAKRYNNNNNNNNNAAGYQNFPNMKNYMFEEQSDNPDYGAGFMTMREKHWLAGIQTIQFHNSNPLEEDFYYTMYQKRHHGSGVPKPNNMLTQQQSESQSRFNNSYTQLHFENSLGKVLIGSVITPRKMIDIETNDFAQSSTPNRTVISQINSKQILLEIEHMYTPLLKIEQIYYTIRNKAQAAPTVQQYIDELTNILTNHLHHFVSYVSIRKGKQLVHRILPHLKNPSFLWSILFGSSICTIISKDSDDQLLLLFLPYIRQWIFCLSLVELNQIAEYLMKNISFVLKSVFGISVIANMIERAEEVRTSTEPLVLEKWSNFISHVIYFGSETTIQKPVIGLDKKIIEKHLLYLPLDQSITIDKKINLVQRLGFLGDTTKK